MAEKRCFCSVRPPQLDSILNQIIQFQEEGAVASRELVSFAGRDWLLRHGYVCELFDGLYGIHGKVLGTSLNELKRAHARCLEKHEAQKGRSQDA